MPNPFRKGWKYLTSSLDAKIEENADPQIQINQAVEAAKKQHQQVSEQAATLIGQQRQLEMKLNRLLEDQERIQSQARQALTLADKARSSGEETTATEYEQAAEVLAAQLVSVEQQIDDTRTMHQNAQAAAEQAKNQQKESEARLQQQLSELEQLRSQAVQADMQQKATEALDSTRQFRADDSTPTLDSVRDKIERRYANALGAQELVRDNLSENIANVEAIEKDMRASARLDQIRAELDGGSSTSTDRKQITGGTEDKPENPGNPQP
ncbi:PspA/IM30 family protein [Corynebacterium uropygiale]|uniref:PspA/IM30 family protein n=1 Tax=Corynebacterium uropygiale TaxID=1775911 RepID=A0A9X1U1A5_9CORY|nr:PspA/IM30 family protein [Corynebacterium uropygiale]MCF4007699.1 PspA/IM30 family protein [Corynebacterium uropygiale]